MEVCKAFDMAFIWRRGDTGDTSLKKSVQGVCLAKRQSFKRWSQDSTTSVERPKGCKGPGARGGDFEFLGRLSKCLVFGRPNSI